MRSSILYGIGGSIGHGSMTQAAELPVLAADRWPRVEIDILSPSDWPALRSARLAALRDSPDAFVATVEAEAARTPEDWIVSIELSTWAVARDPGGIVGIACLSTVIVDARREHFIESVWVTAAFRQRGLIREMFFRLEQEARADGAVYLQLWVLENNESAYNAYMKLDFNPVPDSMQDSWKQRHDGTFVQERLLVKQIW